MFYLEVKKEYYMYQGGGDYYTDWCWEEISYATSLGEIDAAIERLFPNQEYRVIQVVMEGTVL